MSDDAPHSPKVVPPSNAERPAPPPNEGATAAATPAAPPAPRDRTADDFTALAQITGELTLTEEGRALLAPAEDAEAVGAAAPGAAAPEATVVAGAVAGASPPTAALGTAPSGAPPPPPPPQVTKKDNATDTATPPNADPGGAASPSPRPRGWRRLPRPRLAAAGLVTALALAAAVALRARPDDASAGPAVATAPAPAPGPAAAGQGTAGTATQDVPAGQARAPGGPAAGSVAAAVRPAGERPAAAWPAPRVQPLTLAHVQSLDCVSLRAAVQDGQGPVGLLRWAQFRLAWACADAEAGRLLPPPTKPEHRRHVTSDGMLAIAGQVGLAQLGRAAPAAPMKLPSGSWQRTPQGRLVVAMRSGDGAPGGEAEARRRSAAARRLLAVRSLGADGQLAAAALFAPADAREATAALVALVRRGDGMALARASHALAMRGAFLPLTWAALERAPALSPEALPALLAQASPVHRRWLLDVAMRVALLQGNAVAASDLAQQALRCAPSCLRALSEARALAGVLALSGEVAAPRDEVPAAHRCAGPEGWTAKTQGAPAAARAAWAAARADRTATPEARAELAAAALWQDPLGGDPLALALSLVADAARAAPDDVHRAAMVRLLEDWAQARPTDDAPLEALARLGADLRDYGMQRDARQALALRHPHDEGAELALVLATLEAGQLPAAQALLQALEPNVSAAMRPELAYVRARGVAAHDPLQARALLASASKIRPDARYEAFLADLLEAHGQLDEAALALGRACTLAPEDDALAVRRADLLVRLGELGAARQALDKLVAQRPQATAAYARLADVAHRQGDLPGAAAALQVLCGRADAPTDALLRLARLQLLEMGQLQAGVATLRRILAAAEAPAEAHYLLGLGLRDAGDDVGMRRAWQRYLALEPRGPYAAEVRATLRR